MTSLEKKAAVMARAKNLNKKKVLRAWLEPIALTAPCHWAIVPYQRVLCCIHEVLHVPGEDTAVQAHLQKCELLIEGAFVALNAQTTKVWAVGLFGLPYQLAYLILLQKLLSVAYIISILYMARLRGYHRGYMTVTNMEALCSRGTAQFRTMKRKYESMRSSPRVTVD